MKIEIRDLSKNMDRLHQHEWLKGQKPKCYGCGKFGFYGGSFCPKCNHTMSWGYRDYECLKETYGD